MVGDWIDATRKSQAAVAASHVSSANHSGPPGAGLTVNHDPSAVGGGTQANDTDDLFLTYRDWLIKSNFTDPTIRRAKTYFGGDFSKLVPHVSRYNELHTEMLHHEKEFRRLEKELIEAENKYNSIEKVHLASMRHESDLYDFCRNKGAELEGHFSFFPRTFSSRRILHTDRYVHKNGNARHPVLNDDNVSKPHTEVSNEGHAAKPHNKQENLNRNFLHDIEDWHKTLGEQWNTLFHNKHLTKSGSNFSNATGLYIACH